MRSRIGGAISAAAESRWRLPDSRRGGNAALEGGCADSGGRSASLLNRCSSTEAASASRRNSSRLAFSRNRFASSSISLRRRFTRRLDERGKLRADKALLLCPLRSDRASISSTASDGRAGGRVDMASSSRNKARSLPGRASFLGGRASKRSGATEAGPAKLPRKDEPADERSDAG